MTQPDTDPIECRQCGVLTRRQAVARFGAAAVRRNLAAGRWVAVGRVLVLHSGPLPPDQLLWLTLLSGPPGSALGSWSALAFDGLRTAAALPAHLVIPNRARRPVLSGRAAGALVTRSVALGLDDVHPLRAPRRTRPARSLVDAAALAPDAIQARLALVQGIQAGVTTTASLRSALVRRGRCRYAGLLGRTLDDLDGGIRSLPEQDFATLVRRAGLPTPQRQALVRDGAGRYYLDADWPERSLSAEVHGIHHARMSQLERDWDRHNSLTVRARRRVLHFTSHQVRTDPEGVAALLGQAMVAIGSHEDPT